MAPFDAKTHRVGMVVFADASLCLQTGAAGWGAWAKRDDWSRGRFMGGPILFKDGSGAGPSNRAELAGIGYALWTLHRAGDLDGVQHVMIQCDNTSALGMIVKSIKRVKVIKHGRAFVGPATVQFHNRPIIATIKEVLAGKAISVKHVKAHTSNEDGRSWVNRHCDAEAKRNMQAQRKVLRGVVSSASV